MLSENNQVQYKLTVKVLAEDLMKKAEHFALNSGDTTFATNIDSNAHKDVADYLRTEGFIVTCIDQVAQRYQIDWK